MTMTPSTAASRQATARSAGASGRVPSATGDAAGDGTRLSPQDGHEDGRGGPGAGQGEETRLGRYQPTDNDPMPAVDPLPVSRPEWLLWNIGLPLILLAAVVGLVFFLGTIEPSTRPPADTTLAGRMRALPAARVLPVASLQELGNRLRLNIDGTVVPYREVVVATEVNGQVVYKSPVCEAGRYVSAGTELIRIDPTDYEFEVQRLQRLQEQEYEALGEVDQEMINARRSMEIADADIELQQREVARLESLPKDFASQGELDQARRQLLQAEQQKVNYQNQLELLGKRRGRLEAAERLAATQLKAAEADLQRTSIKAPIDGVVVTENAELNTFVSRGSAVVTMEDTSKVEVSASLRSDQLYWVLNQNGPVAQSGTLVDPTTEPIVGDYKLPPTPVRVIYQVAGRDDTRYIWSGRLLGYDGIGMDERTRTVPIRVVVDQPREFRVEHAGRPNRSGSEASRISSGPTALVRGMFVKMQLELDPAVPLVVVPAEALRPGNRVWQFVADSSVLDPPDPPEGDDADGDGSEGDEVAAAREDSAAEEPGPQEAAQSEESTEPGDDDPEESDSGTESDSGKEDAKDKETEPVFDPSRWVAGRLVVRDAVRPVDSLSADGSFDGEAAEEGEADKRMLSGDYWICEVPAESLDGESFVVVSPLGAVQSDSVPVRVPAAQLTVDFADLTTATAVPVREAAADD